MSSNKSHKHIGETIVHMIYYDANDGIITIIQSYPDLLCILGESKNAGYIGGNGKSEYTVVDINSNRKIIFRGKGKGHGKSGKTLNREMVNCLDR